MKGYSEIENEFIATSLQTNTRWSLATTSKRRISHTWITPKRNLSIKRGFHLAFFACGIDAEFVMRRKMRHAAEKSCVLRLLPRSNMFDISADLRCGKRTRIFRLMEIAFWSVENPTFCCVEIAFCCVESPTFCSVEIGFCCLLQIRHFPTPQRVDTRVAPWITFPFVTFFLLSYIILPVPRYFYVL